MKDVSNVYLAGALLVGAWAHHAKPKALQEIIDVSFIPKAMNAFPKLGLDQITNKFINNSKML